MRVISRTYTSNRYRESAEVNVCNLIPRKTPIYFRKDVLKLKNASPSLWGQIQKILWDVDFFFFLFLRLTALTLLKYLFLYLVSGNVVLLFQPHQLTRNP